MSLRPYSAALVDCPGQVNGVVLPLLVRFDDLQHPPEPTRDDYGNIISEVSQQSISILFCVRLSLFIYNFKFDVHGNQSFLGRYNLLILGAEIR
jgi:hypothetical protein